MLFDNVLAEFYSQPSDPKKPTSKYFVCANGTVRAKLAADEVYSRPYNICYVDQEARNYFGKGYKGKSASYSEEKKQVSMVWAHKNDSSKEVTVIGKLTSDDTHNRVYEFDCDDSGVIGSKHMGSKITDTFNAQSSGHSEDDVDTACAKLMNSQKSRVTKFTTESI